MWGGSTVELDGRGLAADFNPSFVSWARLLCIIWRDILYLVSRLAIFDIRRSSHFDSKNKG